MVAITVVSALNTLFSPTAAAASEVAIAKRKVALPIGGKGITAEVFESAGRKSGRTIVVLHGAGGTLLDGPEMRRVSRALAGAGDTVYLLHYFERTGTLFARDATMQKNFALWLETVRESVGAIQRLQNSSAPVGIYGYSLGGFLALLAASDNPQVGAVVEHAGGVWNGRTDRIGKLPPLLMIHGKRDARVPFAKYAAPLLPVARAHAPAVETSFFPDEGHVFTADAMVEVRRETEHFFARKLAARD